MERLFNGDCLEHLEMNGFNLPWENISLLEMSPLYVGVEFQEKNEVDFTSNHLDLIVS